MIWKSISLGAKEISLAEIAGSVHGPFGISTATFVREAAAFHYLGARLSAPHETP